jgi:hypothetical protein
MLTMTMMWRILPHNSPRPHLYNISVSSHFMLPLRQLRGSVSLLTTQASLLSRQHVPVSRTTIHRAMATLTGKKIEWLVILPDREGALERRMEVRPYVAVSPFQSPRSFPASYLSSIRSAQHMLRTISCP